MLVVGIVSMQRLDDKRLVSDGQAARSASGAAANKI